MTAQYLIFVSTYRTPFEFRIKNAELRILGGCQSYIQTQRTD